MPYGDARLGHLDQDHVDLGHVLGADDAEALAGSCWSGPAVGVGREVLGQRVAEAHVHRAFDLPVAQQRVDRAADVVDGHDPLDLPRLAVDDHELRGVAERGVDDRVLEFGSPSVFVQSTRYSPT